MSHTVIRSKMMKTRPLLADPIISRHVPETGWLTAARLTRMLKTYSAVYIKPNIGRRGNGIIRVNRVSRSVSKISYGDTDVMCATKNVMVELKKILNPQKKYIIQQGIDLATFHNRPFDVRVVLHKPLNRWRLTWMSAKVAHRKNAVVTNVARGAKDVTLVRTLRGIDQSVNVHTTLRDLIDVSYQIAQILGSTFPLNIVGLDMAIDKSGEIWFIEANTRPDFRGLRKVDPTQYRKYRSIKRLISSR